MTAATVTEFSRTDLPYDVKYGTGKRRALLSIRYTSANTSDTILLTTYMPNVADIEGIVWDSVDSAKAATAATWSTVTLTTAGHTGSGIGEIGLIVNFT
jgi:hypothetical protein